MGIYRTAARVLAARLQVRRELQVREEAVELRERAAISVQAERPAKAEPQGRRDPVVRRARELEDQQAPVECPAAVRPAAQVQRAPLAHPASAALRGARALAALPVRPAQAAHQPQGPEEALE